MTLSALAWYPQGSLKLPQECKNESEISIPRPEIFYLIDMGWHLALTIFKRLPEDSNVQPRLITLLHETLSSLPISQCLHHIPETVDNSDSSNLAFLL